MFGCHLAVNSDVLQAEQRESTPEDRASSDADSDVHRHHVYRNQRSVGADAPATDGLQPQTAGSLRSHYDMQVRYVSGNTLLYSETAEYGQDSELLDV